MKGIRRHGAGWQAEVRVVGHPRSVQQFPLNTDPAVIAKWRKTEHARLKLTSPRAIKGSFAANARNYLSARRAMPSFKERERHISLWVHEFGTRERSSIRPWEIAAVRDRWLTEGPRRVWRTWQADGIDRYGGRWVDLPEPLSASAVNKRLRALENLWTVLDGRHAYNPVREVPEAQEPEGEARALSYEVVRAILAQLPDRGRPTGEGEGTRPRVSLTKLRLGVIAFTGLTHRELARIRTVDLHIEEAAPWVWVHGRAKGKGTRGSAQPLTQEGAEALRALAAANGLGPFSNSAMWKSFQRACSKLNLTGIRPYDLRHSFATEVFAKSGGNLAATQLLMRHRSQVTTLRYGKGAVNPVMAAAMSAVRQAGGFSEPDEKP